MNFFDNIGTGITQAIDTVVEKNRRLAYTNRLKYVIKSETETLNRAYIALGKHFYKDLKGDPESAEVERLCKVIDVAQERLKKAQDRLEYVIMYGIPENNKTDAAPNDYEPVIVDSSEDDEGDITICVSDNAEIPSETEAAVDELSAEVEPNLNALEKEDKSNNEESSDNSTESL